LKSKKGTIAAIAAVAAFLEEEEKAQRLAMPLRRPVLVSNLWHISGREEIMRMRMLWQRRIVPK
jgi:hypothetical protein